MIRDLAALWDEIESRDEIRAVVIASSNFAVFCAGADIKEFTKMTDPAAGKELLDGGHGVLRRMERSSKVTIAAVNSLALGGGCELAMACDFRIAAESASFGQPEINLGIIPGFGGTQRLPRLVGEAKALEMNLLGEPISAPRGLRARARQRGRPGPRAVRHGAGLGAEARRPGAGGGRADQEGFGERRPGSGHRGGEGSGFATAFGSEDAREGIAAFLGKRKPKWSRGSSGTTAASRRQAPRRAQLAELIRDASRWR